MWPPQGRRHPVSTKEQIANVGRISAGDAAIGDKIVEAADA
ncbi:MAG: hypothetical protein ACLUE1_04725 [Adlercreutzia equolifaciens]